MWLLLLETISCSSEFIRTCILVIPGPVTVYSLGYLVASQGWSALHSDVLDHLSASLM